MPSAIEIIQANPEWYHSIELAPGVVTPGRVSLAEWKTKLAALQLPDLRGKSVLDIGAYDGFFAFAAEQLGAARVVALDHYVWSVDMVGYMQDWRAAQAQGQTIPAPHKTRHWQPEALPGRRPFDAVRAHLGSKVEPIVGDFMTMDLAALGKFDVVLFLGVLYHLENPLLALQKVAQLTGQPGGLAVIETEAMEIPGLGGRAVCEFFPGQELNHDESNWWAPNAAALTGMGQVAGFTAVQVLPQPQSANPLRAAARSLKNRLAAAGLWQAPMRYRLVVHATKR
jgi:tRNA (mo5U34)-methyltransferase